MDRKNDNQKRRGKKRIRPRECPVVKTATTDCHPGGAAEKINKQLNADLKKMRGQKKSSGRCRERSLLSVHRRSLKTCDAQQTKLAWIRRFEESCAKLRQVAKEAGNRGRGVVFGEATGEKPLSKKRPNWTVCFGYSSSTTRRRTQIKLVFLHLDSTRI